MCSPWDLIPLAYKSEQELGSTANGISSTVLATSKLWNLVVNTVSIIVLTYSTDVDESSV